MAMARDIIAEQDDDVGAERIGALDDRRDPLDSHPGFAGMQVRDHGDRERQVGGPLLRRKVITHDTKPERRFANSIRRARGAERADAADETEKLTP